MYRAVFGLLMVVIISNVLFSQIKIRGQKMEMKIESSVFKHGEMIPRKYTCEGENISPPLSWSHPPEGTRTLALIINDPDAPSGDFVHCILYDIPSNITHLQEGISTTINLPEGAIFGTNGASRTGYMGPCPPSGTHRYYFRLYAINKVLQLDAGANKRELLEAMKDHIIAQGELMGKYKKTN